MNLSTECNTITPLLVQQTKLLSIAKQVVTTSSAFATTIVTTSYSHY